MPFHRRRNLIQSIFKSHKTIENVSLFSFLGIMIDENLTWKNQVNMPTNELCKIKGVLYRLTYIYPKHIPLTIIYNSFFISHFNSGSYHVDVGCYMTIQTKLLYLMSGGSVLLVSLFHLL